MANVSLRPASRPLGGGVLFYYNTNPTPTDNVRLGLLPETRTSMRQIPDNGPLQFAPLLTPDVAVPG